jgi:hypothetical protein
MIYATTLQAPEYSAFYRSFNGLGMYDMLQMTPAASAAADPAKIMRAYGLTEPEIAAEMILLSNAIEFFAATAKLISGPHIDMGYGARFPDRNLHSRMPLVPTPARFK